MSIMEPLTPSQLRKQVHPDDWKFFLEVRRVGKKAAKTFDLPVDHVEPKRRPWSGGSTGRAYVYGYGIRMLCMVFRFRDGQLWHDNPRSREYVWGTLAHELAHFGGHHFGKPLALLNHGLEFNGLASDIEVWIQDHRREV